RFTAFILSFEENLAIKNAPPIVSYVSNNWGALQFYQWSFIEKKYICIKAYFILPIIVYNINCNKTDYN
ncbi:hypothetical protein, partial [Bacillus cereus]|uniref:hypothetical protein n=1 Tax=Bacillus cereus TaxID=1396 RepID=UPI003A8CB100